MKILKLYIKVYYNKNSKINFNNKLVQIMTTKYN